MRATHQVTGMNDRDEGFPIGCIPSGESTQGGVQKNFSDEIPYNDLLRPIYEESQKEPDFNYKAADAAGEIEASETAVKKIVELLKDAINLLDEVLEVYDDEIERMNTFSLIEEKIKSLWELREDADSNFTDLLVLLEVAVKNSRCQDYRENQFKSIKAVLEQMREVCITPEKLKECRTLLLDSGIDLFAPTRNWENYTVEIKKKDASG
ncbi:MAG: hypothetical protein KAW12_27060 [Candidatus Aminicenantes bacterium]|nr:hypothetical protein [Candidatus Aminicenantes bacterium]